jgi:hypothetical protein
MPDVRMPDGTIMRNVPANATKAQILAAHAKAREAGAVPDNRPKSFWQGIAEGIHTPANNTIRAVDNINPFMIAYDKLMGALGHNQPSHADVIDKAYHNARAKSGYQGGTGGTIVGNIAGTLPALIFGGGPMTQGAIQGVMLTKNRDAGGIAADAGIGVVGGKIGDVVGRRVIAPVVNAALRTKAGQAVSATAKAALAKVPSVSTLLTAAPRLNAPEKTVTRINPDVARVQANLQDAQRLGVPYAIADASPKTRALAGAVSRKSIDARQLAEDTFGPRQFGQAQRANEAINAHLAPITNIAERSAAIKKQAQAAAEPFYKAAYARPAPSDEELASILKTPVGQSALKDAVEIAQIKRKSPTDLGFIVDDSGNVSLQSDAGRYATAAMGNPTDRLDGPAPRDLISYLRASGGIADSGGELSHMGIGNANRAGLEHTGLDNRFGPLVHPNGRNLDDAALNAWEAGYFPELSDRPSVNEFLDAVRGSHEGWGRRFLPEDQARIDAYQSALAEKNGLQQGRFETGKAPVMDTSVPAGFDDMQIPPMSAYGEKEVKLPTMETLDLVKRGFDRQLNPYRDAFGKLNLEGDAKAQATLDLLNQYKARLDDISPDYYAARSSYQDAIQPRSALQMGFNELPKGTLPARDFDAAISGLNEKTMPEAQRGYATALADRVDKMRFSGDPYKAVYGSPQDQAKIASLFPEGSQGFGRIAQLESDMGKTAYETIGGSPTAARLQADDALASPIGGALENVASPKTALARLALQKARDQVMTRGQKNAEKIAPVLFNTNPAEALAFINSLTQKQADIEAQRAAYGRLMGGIAIPGAVAFNQ